jgi:hypothetical protein
MTLSDAQPVQFWVNGQQTFNEKEVDGVHHVCFCQPFKSSDEIKIQFTDDSYQSFILKLFDSDNNIVHVFDFTENASGIYSLSFIPENYSPDLSGTIRFVIVRRDDIVNGEFVGSLLPATVSGSGNSWTWDSGNSGRAIVTLPNSFSTTKRLLLPLSIKGGNTYKFRINFDVVDGGNGAGSTTSVFLYLSNNVNFGNNTTYTNIPLGTNQSVDLTIDSINDWPYVIIVAVAQASSSFARIVRINSITLLSPILETEMAYSDCINISDNQSETILINYSNHRDFAGIDNLDVSPDQDFNLRIPATFFQERFPQEGEVIELSNSRLIQLNAQIRAQRKLKIGPMPPYMHRKLLLALSCQFVNIDDKSWVRQESYDIVDGRDTWPLKQASVWLTEKDYIQRNIL